MGGIGIMCLSVMDNCINRASYGEICVQCNACGRFGGSKEYMAKLKLYMLMQELKEHAENILEEDFDTVLQQKNIVLRIQSISKECSEMLTELEIIKEVPEGSFGLCGLDIKFSEWLKEGGISNE
jgi:hypothetical protein